LRRFTRRTKKGEDRAEEVRSRVNPHTLRAPIEAILRDASGGMPVAHVRTIAEGEMRNTARQPFNMLLLIIFEQRDC
jgi:putative ABC transport system permease protein